jgi:hypothetical protein
MSPKQMDAFEFWQRSRKALDELQGLMNTCAGYVPHTPIPRHVANDIAYTITRFKENFRLLVHAQKKAGK